jgi:hypothetical protein
MDAIKRMEHMIEQERNPRLREEMRKVLANTIKKMEVLK